ncbi:N-acetylmuramate alpha-1-phosphate uridylyltransferase [Sessilibacter sp. MAH1]
MKAMLLAAGFGKRMLPLTAHTPKPLLEVGKDSLIGHQLTRLKQAGITEVVINVAYLGQQIIDKIGDGSDRGLTIHYSVEEEPLETAGGIDKALAILGEEPFLLVNGDIWTDVDLAQFSRLPLHANLARLLLVNNPDHNPNGDFSVSESGQILPSKTKQTFTYSGVALIDPKLITRYQHRREAYPLKEVFDAAIALGKLGASIHSGLWLDIGTPERLEALRDLLSK